MCDVLTKVLPKSTAKTKATSEATETMQMLRALKLLNTTLILKCPQSDPK